MPHPRLQMSVLGGLGVLRGRAPLPLPRSRKTRALLAYLALTARPHRRERLCRLLWSVPDDPRAALRWSLSHLRRLVDGPDRPRIVADRDNVSFDRTGVAIDIVDVRARLPADLHQASTSALRRAAETFRGELLEGLDLPDCQDFHTWCVAEREEARRLHSRVLAALVERLRARPEDALSCARERALLEPLDEDAQATLVRLLRAAGRVREAEAQLRAAERRLEVLGAARTGALRRAHSRDYRHSGDRVAPLALAPRPPGRQAPPTGQQQPVQFCSTSDGVRIAYATVGNGPPLVRAAHWLGHLEFERHTPVWRHWTAEFSRRHTFVRYDERGSGLSDWTVSDLSFEAFVCDLEAVVDALELERFPLIGSSKGGPIAIAYAVRHPERVSQLVLLGTFAQGWCKRGEPAEIARQEAMITLTREGWTQDNPAYRQIFTTRFMPDAGPEQFAWFNELQRVTASAENAVRLLRAIGDIDVVDLLPRVRVPTLVLHLREDSSVPFAQGRLLASRIPGARFVPLEGRNHIILPHEPAWPRFVSELRAFLEPGGTAMARSGRR